MRHRLLAINVLTRLACIDDHSLMPMVGHRRDQAVNVLPIEQFLIAPRRGQVGITGNLLGQRVTAVIKIGCPNALDPRQADRVRQQARPLHSDSNDSHSHPFAVRHRLRAAARHFLLRRIPFGARKAPVATAEVFKNRRRGKSLCICCLLSQCFTGDPELRSHGRVSTAIFIPSIRYRPGTLGQASLTMAVCYSLTIRNGDNRPRDTDCQQAGSYFVKFTYADLRSDAGHAAERTPNRSTATSNRRLRPRWHAEDRSAWRRDRCRLPGQGRLPEGFRRTQSRPQSLSRSRHRFSVGISIETDRVHSRRFSSRRTRG